MYNNPTEPIPLFLPVATAAQLRPWFDTTTLDLGLEEIRRRHLSPVAAARNTVGVLIGEKAVVILSFDKSATLHQGFFHRQRPLRSLRRQAWRQSLPPPGSPGDSGLVEPDKARRPLPLPLAFAGGKWQKLGGFLHDWFAKVPL